MEDEIIRGYKALNKDMSSRYGDMKYDIGRQYRLEGELILCENGYHFCENMIDVSRFYDIDNSRVFEIEARGNIISNSEKSCSDDIRLIRELSKEEIATIINKNYNNEDVDIRRVVVQSKYLNNETLEKMNNDIKPNIRYTVAENLNTDEQILKKMNDDEDDDVRCTANENLNKKISKKF